MHSESTEFSAVPAMLDPNYSYSPDTDPYLWNSTNTDHTGPLNQDMLNTYLKAWQGSEIEGIRDTRFTLIRDSMAYRILMVAQVPGFPYSAAMDRLPQSVLAEMSRDTHGLIVAQCELIQDGVTDDVKKAVKAASEVALKHLLRYANVIVTTLSMATSNGFIVHRQATAVACEETGHVDDVDMVSFYSQYLLASARFLSGSWQQMPPSMFGKELENNLHAQGALSHSA
jgi:hypothetical protein